MFRGEVIAPTDVIEPDDVVHDFFFRNKRQRGEHPDLQPLGQERTLLRVDFRELRLQVFLAR